MAHYMKIANKYLCSATCDMKPTQAVLTKIIFYKHLFVLSKRISLGSN